MTVISMVTVIFHWSEMNDLTRIARKIIFVLFVEQSLASAGFIAAATLTSIVAEKLSNDANWAGVPTAVYLLAGAFSAFAWGYVMDAIGRRGALTLGLFLGVIGSAVSVYAIVQSSLSWFLLGMVFMGVANAAVQLSRFAAAEVSPPDARGRAISNVVIGGTVGAVLGPILVEPAGKWILPILGDELAGAYVISLVLFFLGMIAVFFGLRPDPREIGMQVAEKFPEMQSGTGAARSILEVLSQPAALTAVIAMSLGQAVMVLVMVITSLHMKDHNHLLGDISVVISAHTLGMFAFSIISGRLADRFGREPIILVGASTLILACLAATISPDVLPLGVALFLLGLGWNFCFVAGSALFSDQLSQVERSRMQGFSDLLIGLSSAAGSLSSGLIFAAVGYNMMAYISAGLSIIPVIVVIEWMIRKKNKPLTV
jgi:MFS family permease